jgi:hypothetical protein
MDENHHPDPATLDIALDRIQDQRRPDSEIKVALVLRDAKTAKRNRDSEW